MSYLPGQRVRLTTTFRNEAGALADTTAVIKVKNADGVTTEYAAPTHDSTGVYHQDITITASASGNGGTWWYRGEGTGAVIAAAQKSFPVEQQEV